MPANNQRGLLVEPMFVICYIYLDHLNHQSHVFSYSCTNSRLETALETALAQKLESLDTALSYSQNCFKDYRQEMYEATGVLREGSGSEHFVGWVLSGSLSH